MDTTLRKNNSLGDLIKVKTVIDSDSLFIKITLWSYNRTN